MPSTTFTSLFTKLLDNVNAGKVVTDVGPGLLLTVPILMVLSLLTGTSLMPADRLSVLDSDLFAARRLLASEYGDLHRLVSVNTVKEDGHDLLGALPVGPTLEHLNTNSEFGRTPQDIRELNTACDLIHRQAVFRVALLESELSEQQRLLQLSQDAPLFARSRDITRLKTLLGQKLQRIEIFQAKIDSLETKRAEANTLEKTLALWETNIATIAGFAVVLGVILSQVNRYVFFEFLFSRVFGKGVPPRNTPTAATLLDAAKTEAHEELVRNYYRYAEGSVNMAIPVLFLGAASIPYLRQIPGLSPAIITGVPLGCASISLLLVLSGFTTFKTFREKSHAIG